MLREPHLVHLLRVRLLLLHHGELLLRQLLLAQELQLLDFLRHPAVAHHGRIRRHTRQPHCISAAGSIVLVVASFCGARRPSNVGALPAPTHVRHRVAALSMSGSTSEQCCQPRLKTDAVPGDVGSNVTQKCELQSRSVGKQRSLRLTPLT